MGRQACERTTMPTTTAPMCMMWQVTILRLCVTNHKRGVDNHYAALKIVVVS